MKKKLCKIVSLMLVLVFTMAAFSGCKKKADNNSSPFVIAIDALDEVFNPFFYTSAADRTVLSYMNVGLISVDKDGNMVANDSVQTVAKDFSVFESGTNVDKPTDETTNNGGKSTTYQFLIKNNLVFSDDSPLTIDDVLFNLYVYLDPAYSGSSTIYSTNIYGLGKYRAQDNNIISQAGFDAFMREAAIARRNNIIDWTRTGASKDYPEADSQLGKDLKVVEELFREELESDWATSQGLINEYTKYGITEGWQVFLLLCGVMSINANDQLVWNGYDSYTGATDKETIINSVYESKTQRITLSIYKENMRQIITEWATSQTSVTALTALAMEDHFDSLRDEEGNLPYSSIDGIKAHRKVTSFKNQNGETVSLSESHDVLEIKINGIDPKAIYNFSIPVTPRKYYSSPEQLALQNADPDSHFGVEFSSVDFMTDYIKARKVPIGAGSYKATSKSNKEDETAVTFNEFLDGNVCYLQRNDRFMLGQPKIKYLRYQVVNQNNVFEQVRQGTIHYAEVDAKPETITKATKEKKKMGYLTTKTSGYGYIGVNPRFVTNIDERRAIMSAMDTSLCLNYYSNGLAELIYRPMSKTIDWCYPKDITTPYYEFSAQKTEQYLINAGYSRVNNKYVKLVNGSYVPLKLTFTIAGDGDHPMADTFYKAQSILNNLGCDISVKQDARALSKLASGNLEVWAAAWSSTIDPDMYQVYHRDSAASSVLNWGYPHILSNNIKPEVGLINELSTYIEEARLTNDRTTRARIYRSALDTIMELAYELPTYQRENLYIFNKEIIDTNSMTPREEITAYNDPISELWNISYNGN